MNESNTHVAFNPELTQFSQDLDAYLRPLQELLEDAWSSLECADDFSQRYREYLIQTFHYVKLSVPLMAEACKMLDYRHTSVQKYLGRHTDEEAGHDGWLLDDLAALGVAAGTVLERLPNRGVLAMTGSQYYLIKHVHPLTILGYIYALESQPWSRLAVMALHENHDIPVQALSTLLGHAEDDPQHADDLRRLLNNGDINKNLQQSIAYSARITLDHLVDIYHGVEDAPLS